MDMRVAVVVAVGVWVRMKHEKMLYYNITSVYWAASYGWCLLV